MNKKYGPLYVEDTIPKATYRGHGHRQQERHVWNILVPHEKMSDQMAYNIVKTLFEKSEDLVAVHQEAENIELEMQKACTPIPFHPGAQKYFEEKGVKVN